MFSYILRTLFDPGASLQAYLRRAVPLQIGGALLLSFLGMLLQPPPDAEPTPILIEDVVLVAMVFMVMAPAAGTLAISGAIWVIRRFTMDPMMVALASGAFFGALALIVFNLAFGLATAWSFFCFTAAFQVGELTSTRHGVLAAGLMQLIYNVLPTLLVLIVAAAGPQASLPG